MAKRAINFLPYPLEFYVSYLTSSVPVPPRGFHKLVLHAFDGDIIEITPPPPNALPMCDMSFYPLARHLSPENIIRAMSYIILERPVIFISSKPEVLSSVIEALMVLIFPFEYQMIYIPLLPSKMLDVLQANCPYLVGVHRSLYEKFERFISLSTYVVDLDKDEVSYREKKWIEANISKYKPKGELAPLPEHERKKLLSRVVPLFSKLKSLGDTAVGELKNDEHDTLINKIRESFLLFLVSSLKSCGEFYEKKDGEYRIDREKLIVTAEEDYKWFLVQFTKTQMFLHWEYSKQHPKSYTEAYNLLFFDESVTSKQNRIASLMSTKKPTPFLDEKKAFAIQSMEVIKMPKPGEATMDRKAVVEAYAKNIPVSPLMQVKKQDGTMGYYYRFLSEFVPELLQSMKFGPPPDLVADCEKRLKALKFVPEIQELEEKPIVNPTRESKVIELWLKLWCKTFVCHGIQEHQYRLDQLLDVLAQYQCKSIAHLIDIHSEILQVCYYFGSARLAIQFFESINSNIICSNPKVLSLFLLAISSGESAQPLHEDRRLSKNGNLDEFEEAKIKPEDQGGFLDYQTYFRSCLLPFQQRTFLTEKIGHVVSEEIKLGLSLEKCSQCNKDVQPIIPGEEKEERVTCQECGTELKTKVRVRVGRPVIYAKDSSVFWENEFEILKLENLLEIIKGLGINGCVESVLSLNDLRKNEMVFWNIIWYCRLYGLPYDLFLPYKAAKRKSLLLQRKLVREKTATRLHIVPEKENPWFDQFKQIRVFALCTDSEVQTDK